MVRICKKCQGMLDDHEAFCPKCGHPTTDALQYVQPDASAADAARSALLSQEFVPQEKTPVRKAKGKLIILLAAAVTALTVVVICGIFLLGNRSGFHKLENGVCVFLDADGNAVAVEHGENVVWCYVSGDNVLFLTGDTGSKTLYCADGAESEKLMSGIA